MISANTALFAAWLATYCESFELEFAGESVYTLMQCRSAVLVRGRFGDVYRLGQADCPDPSGTALLSAAQTAGIIASFVVGLMCWAT